jgi:hypothetical protein
VYCQSVGQFWPTSTVIGYPEVQRVTPVSCHPPTRASTTLPELPAKRLPRPKGSSASQFALNWWVVSKSETAHCERGLKAFSKRLPTNPMF